MGIIIMEEYFLLEEVNDVFVDEVVEIEDNEVEFFLNIEE